MVGASLDLAPDLRRYGSQFPRLGGCLGWDGGELGRGRWDGGELGRGRWDGGELGRGSWDGNSFFLKKLKN